MIQSFQLNQCFSHIRKDLINLIIIFYMYKRLFPVCAAEILQLRSYSKKMKFSHLFMLFLTIIG